MDSAALVIGGGVAGLQAALDLADAGVLVHLVDSSPFLGSQCETNVPGHILKVRFLELAKHPNVRVWDSTKVEKIDRSADLQRCWFHVELSQQPRYVDLSRCTACGECIGVCPVIVPGAGRHAIYLALISNAAGQPGCAAIDKLGIAPCRDACPTGQRAQGYIALMRQKRYADAYWAIRREHPFPSVCGRVCNHRCEDACTRNQVDEPVNIMGLKRFVADWAYAHRTELPNMRDKSLVGTPFEHRPRPTGKKVAVIGAGPAGLTAALDLVRLGHGVSVFDVLPAAGGMMRVGIPPHRLPDELLDWEIQQIIDEGVELKLNSWVNDVPGLLRQGYDSVLIATGAHRARKLPLKNSDHPDNWLSLDLLCQVGLGERIDLYGRKVVVLGGGNVALDTARTVLRLGASQACMACLEPRGEMPGFAWEIGVAEEEGIRIFPGRTFKEIIVQENKITGVRCVEVNFRGFKEGRPDFDEIPGTEHILPADLVVWAIGQAPNLSFLPQDGSLRILPSDDPTQAEMAAEIPGIFWAGDLRRGVTFFVVDAISDGHKAARSIDRYLRGAAGMREPIMRPVVKLSEETVQAKLDSGDVSRKGRVDISCIPVEARIHNFREVDLTLSEEEALAEAERCLRCAICSECLECLAACQRRAIDHDMPERCQELDIGAIIYAADPASFSQLCPQPEQELAESSGVYRAQPADALAGSAAAGLALRDLQATRRSLTLPAIPDAGDEPAQAGVFLCRCGSVGRGEIDKVVDLDAVRGRVSAQPGVVHSEIVPFMCSPEAVETIDQAVKASALNRVVLAACSCCASDQVCYSCTYQRVRCKGNFGVFSNARQSERFEFVNIREQCAWAHADDPAAATVKATDLVLAALARSRVQVTGQPAVSPAVSIPAVEQPVLILGSGQAGTICSQVLVGLGVAVDHLIGLPERTWRAGGEYWVARQGIADAVSTSALVLVPHDSAEKERLLAAFGEQAHRPRPDPVWNGVGTHRPGVYFCDPAQNPAISGAAAAVRVRAWLERGQRYPLPVVAVVDPARCRACSTCVEICEFGAPALVGEAARRAAWIDPAICTGCGTCAAHCPSGAITPAHMSDAQVEAALSAFWRDGDDSTPKALVLTCNWNAYSGLETAGAKRLGYSAAVRPLKVDCLGQVSPGMIIKAFEKGADGVLLLGCPPGECHYQFGNRHAEQVFAEAKSLAGLLGYGDAQLQFDRLAAGEGDAFVDKVQRFIAGLNGGLER